MTPLALHRAEVRRLRASGYHTTSRVRVAVRYAVIMDCSITEAARVLGVSAGGVWHAWDRMFPDLPHPLEPAGRAGRGEYALELVDSGMSTRAAAATARVCVQTIYGARSRRRAEA